MIGKALATLVKNAVEYGADEAKTVTVSTIKRGTWPRMKCQYGCEKYGQTLTCPPYTPDLPFMEHFLSEYERSILVKYTLPFTEADYKNWQTIDRQLSLNLLDILVKMEKDAMMMNFYKAFALTAGRCRLCETCNLKRCVHPEKARPSAEACGIDVFALANDNGFSSAMFTGPVKEISVYGLLLVD